MFLSNAKILNVNPYEFDQHYFLKELNDANPSCFNKPYSLGPSLLIRSVGQANVKK